MIVMIKLLEFFTNVWVFENKKIFNFVQMIIKFNRQTIKFIKIAGFKKLFGVLITKNNVKISLFY